MQETAKALFIYGVCPAVLAVVLLTPILGGWMRRRRRASRLPLRLTNRSLSQWAKVEEYRDSYEGTGRPRCV